MINTSKTAFKGGTNQNLILGANCLCQSLTGRVVLHFLENDYIRIKYLGKLLEGKPTRQFSRMTSYIQRVLPSLGQKR